MKYLKFSGFLLSIFLFFSCASVQKIATKDDGKIAFTFLQLNDVYEIAPIQGGKFGGMARVETIHEELLQENPNTMLFLAGDFLNPSLLGTLKVAGERIRGKQMVEVMNAMNFDLVAFGNHEFDLKYKDLQKRLNESNFDWISANVNLKTKENTVPFYKVKNNISTPIKGYYIKEFTDADGTKIKIAFISICIPSNPKDYVEYSNMFVQAKKAYNAVKDSVDVVFGLTHAKIIHDKRIAKLLPNIPLIMGGHEHTNSLDTIGNVVIAKADANAKTVYIHKVSFDKKTKKTKISSTLKEINETIVENKRVGAIVEKWQGILKTKIKEIIANPDKTIYTTEIPLDGRDAPIRSVQTNLGSIITKSMSYAFNDEVDCALVNGGSIRIDDQLSGAINAVDIFRVLPYGGSVFKVKLKGTLLKKVLDYGVKAAGTGAYLQRFNAENKNNQWFIKGNPIDTTQVYTVAFSDYLLKGFDIPFLNTKNPAVLSVYKPKKDELAKDIRKAIISFLTTK